LTAAFTLPILGEDEAELRADAFVLPIGDSIDLRKASFFFFSMSLFALAALATTSTGRSGMGGMLSAYMLKGLRVLSGFGGPLNCGELSLLCHPGTKSSTDLPDFGTPTLGLRP
jgi:hypothetical protein